MPDFAAEYTANKAKYATTPAALAGFQHIQQIKDAGYLNKDFASAKLNDGIKAVATGTAAQYPQLGGSAANIENVAPGKVDDVGFFALPGDDAAKNGLTIWPGTSATYIPSSVQGDKLEAAKKFVAFNATQAGCDAFIKASPPQGPFLSKECTLRRDVSQVAKDTQAYIDSGQGQPGPGVHVADQGPQPGADLHPGRHRPGRPAGAPSSTTGRQEAGRAARPARLGMIGPHRPLHVTQGPAVGHAVERRQDPEGLRHGEHTEHPGTPARAAPGRPVQGAQPRSGAGRTLLVLSSPALIYAIFFVVPTLASFYYSFTRWDLFTSTGSGSRTTETFFAEQALVTGLRNTLIYAVLTSGLKVVLGMAPGPAADFEDHRPRLPALGHLLPGAGQHDRGRAHLHDPDETRSGA